MFHGFEPIASCWHFVFVILYLNICIAILVEWTFQKRCQYTRPLHGTERSRH